MAKKHELRQQLAKAADELSALGAKSEAEGFKQEVYDALKQTIIDLKDQLARVEEAEKIAAALATPVAGQDRTTPTAPPSAHKLYGKLKHFQDREIDGRTVRAVDQAYAAGMWFKATIFGDDAAVDWCKSHGMAVTKAQGEGVDSAGGFLVPEELLANIIVLREEFGVFRKECQVVPMGSDTLNWPRRVGGLTAYFTGENTAITESQAQWDNINLTAKKLGALTRMSNEIAEDAVVSVADWLVGEIAYAFAAKEDDCGFNGDGTSTYGGMRGITQIFADGSHTAGQYTTSSATLTALVAADFTGVMGVLPQYALQRAKWYMSQQMFYSAAGTVLAKAGGNTIATLATDPLQPRLLGFPVVIAQKLPIAAPGSGKVQFLFGDLSKAAALGERRGVTIRRSDHRYFENDQIGLLGTERFDINCHDLGDTVTAGPLVAAKSP
ncbi:MAG TPA: phage major capsid protein [Caulobacteraceae bacterium]|jgi:HK97 family phage major capsid protein